MKHTTLSLLLTICVLVGCQPPTEGYIVDKMHDPGRTSEEMRTFYIEQDGVTRTVQKNVIVRVPEQYALVLSDSNGNQYTAEVTEDVWLALEIGDYVKTNNRIPSSLPRDWMVLHDDELVPVLGRAETMMQDSLAVTR